MTPADQEVFAARVLKALASAQLLKWSKEELDASARKPAVQDAVIQMIASLRAQRETLQAAAPDPSPASTSESVDAASFAEAPSVAPPEIVLDFPEMSPEPSPAAVIAPIPRVTSAAMKAATLNATLFTLPNAKAGQPYSGTLADARGKTPRALRDLRMPNDLGMHIGVEPGQISGTPTLDGEHLVEFEWSSDEVNWKPGTCRLLVNPDPRTLWKKLEPPADALYVKPHLDGTTMPAGVGFRLTAASRRGRSHEHSGSFRDDDFDLRHDEVTGWSLLTVADGAGSAKFSREGSRLACRHFGDLLEAGLRAEAGVCIRSAIDNWDSQPEQAAQGTALEFHQLFYEGAKQAVLAIEGAAEANGATARDYATTLLSAAVLRRGGHIFVATFWMGDGAIGVYGPSGKVRLMGSPDSGDFAGQTRFLDRAAITDPHFAKRERVGRYEDANAIILMTDGVSDPIFQTDHGLATPDLWDSLWTQIGPGLAEPLPHKGLLDWLDFFVPGHHDDRTIALMWRDELASDAP